MDLFKRNSTIAFLVIALIVIVIVGFWFRKPTLTNGDTTLPIKGSANVPTDRGANVKKSDK